MVCELHRAFVYYDPFAEWIRQHIKNKKDNGLLGAAGEPK